MQNSTPSATPSLTLAPAACGWSVQVITAHGETLTEQAPTFAEALSAGVPLADLPKKRASKSLPITVALPARLAVFERLSLPSADPEELIGMVRLQFEKSLPYPLEETAIGYQILSQSDAPAQPVGDSENVQGTGEDAPSEPLKQTTLLACGIHTPAVAALCAPLLEQRHYPQSLTLEALRIAAQAPAGAVVCGIWREEEDILFGIFENRRLSFIEPLTPADDPLVTLPRALMSAEMAGAPLDFHAVLLDPSLSTLADSLSSYLAAPVRDLLPPGPDTELPSGDPLDLTPETWRADQARQERFQILRKQLALAGAVYITLLVLAFGYLTIQTGRLNTIKKETFAQQSQVDTIIERQTRWKALAPAIENQRFVLELLFQTFQSLPTPEARITQFDLSRNQFIVEGEMPTAQQAIAFAEQLKKRPELSGYRFESGQPVILPNEHAQFRIFGK